MTTDFSALPQGARNNFDAGPLSWVMGEIREALAHSKVALSEALTQDFESQATSLRHARAWLHQTHGALQIVDVDGVAIVTETIEDLFDRLISGQLVLTADIAQAIQNGCQALVEYLEELLSGESHQPVRLFPYYKALLEARGAERVHPADLFFPDLTIRPQLPVRQETGSPVDYGVLRVRFEKILLPFLKNSDSDGDPRNAIAMAKIIAQVENAQNGQQARGFWWVMHAFSEAVASGQVAAELYVKQLFARINLQLRRLSEGATGITERVLRDALFFLASVEHPSPRTLQVRSAWQLDGLVPHDYGKLRYGQIDLDSLVLAKEKLNQAKNIWSRIAGGDGGLATAFELEMKELTEAGTRLNSAPLSRLLRELNGIARPAAHARPGDGLGLEMATSLLFVENALNNISRLPEDFPARAEALTSRLLSVVAGEVPADSAQWLNDMSREAQQRQTMTALAGEMLTSLRQVEKTLDAYFNDPADGSVLAPIDQVLHQIEGALTVLDQDDARRAVQHMRAAVQAFAPAGAGAEAESEAVAPDVQARAFRHVAQNVGALSFFIETLQVHSEDAIKRFSFDADEGMFRASLLEKHHAAPARSQNELLPPEFDETADSTTTEQELSRHQQHSAGLALSLSMQPHNPELQDELKKSLEQVRDVATLVDNPDANERAQTAIDLLQQPDFAESADTVSGVVDATTVAEPMPAALVTNATPASSEAVDAELLEIFLLEADEVLACIKDTVPALRAESHNQDHLTTLRRSFHTLKGSSRMVGLNVFGEAAWSIEQVLNLWLSEGRHGTPALGALLEHAAEVLEAWVLEIKTDGVSSRSPQGLADAAGRVRAGGEFQLDAAPEPGTDVQSGPSAVEILPAAPDDTESLATLSAEPAAVELEAEIELPAELQQAEEIQLSDAELAAFGQVPAVDTPAGEPAPLQQAKEPEVGTVLPFTGGPAAATAYDDGIKRIGDLEISVPLHNIYLAEADQLVRQLSNDFAEWRHEPQRRVVIESVHAAHSLAGSSATVGFTPLQEVAHALELILMRLSRQPVALAAAQFDSLEDCVACLRHMLQQFALGDMPAHEPGKVALLDQMLREITAQGELSETPLDVIEEVPDLPSTPEAPCRKWRGHGAARVGSGRSCRLSDVRNRKRWIRRWYSRMIWMPICCRSLSKKGAICCHRWDAHCGCGNRARRTRR